MTRDLLLGDTWKQDISLGNKSGVKYNWLAEHSPTSGFAFCLGDYSYCFLIADALNSQRKSHLSVSLQGRIGKGREAEGSTGLWVTVTLTSFLIG